MELEIIKFVFYSILIVVISKYILVLAIRNLARSLNISAKVIGNVAGITTSMPELLTVTVSSLNGLHSASLFNILSSNVINLAQYFATVLFNKNTKKLRNRAIIIDISLVFATVLIPILLINFHIALTLSIVPLFILLYIFFVYLNNNAHKMYLKDEQNEKDENKNVKINYASVLFDIIALIITGVILFLIGDALGDVLGKLCKMFNVSEAIVGCLLGFITSIPEMITFFESQRHNKQIKNDMKGVVEATNNLLTSNILNLFLIQAIGIIIK